jgi:hypothetical protein
MKNAEKNEDIRPLVGYSHSRNAWIVFVEPTTELVKIEDNKYEVKPKEKTKE